MPIIEPANTQQVLQMSSAVEKAFTELQGHHATDHLRNEERIALDEMKRTEVQDPENPNQAEPSDPDGGGRRRQVRIKKKAVSAETKDKGPEAGSPKLATEGEHGTHLDIRV